MDTDLSGASELIAAVVIGVPLVLLGLFGLSRWEAIRDRRHAREQRRSGRG